LIVRTIGNERFARDVRQDSFNVGDHENCLLRPAGQRQAIVDRLPEQRQGILVNAERAQLGKSS
jgi:hypothetical protein